MWPVKITCIEYPDLHQGGVGTWSHCPLVRTVDLHVQTPNTRVEAIEMQMFIRHSSAVRAGHDIDPIESVGGIDNAQE